MERRAVESARWRAAAEKDMRKLCALLVERVKHYEAEGEIRPEIAGAVIEAVLRQRDAKDTLRLLGDVGTNPEAVQRPQEVQAVVYLHRVLRWYDECREMEGI